MRGAATGDDSGGVVQLMSAPTSSSWRAFAHRVGTYAAFIAVRTVMIALSAAIGVLAAGVVATLLHEFGIIGETTFWVLLAIGAAWSVAHRLDSIVTNAPNAPTKRDLRIRETVAPRLAAAGTVFEAEASRLIDEADRQEALHQRARRALTGRDLIAFQDTVTQITDIDSTHDDIGGFRSLLSDAAEAGATDFGGVLLDHGANVNRADTYRWWRTPLHLAAGRGHVSNS
jgi:hypothetical protein